MTRRFLLLGALGAGLAGCGGADDPDRVIPSVWVDWGYVSTRTSAPRTVVSVPEGAQSVVITFKEASATRDGGDVVARGNRPGVQGTLSNGLSYYGSTELKGAEAILWRDTLVQIDSYQGLNATGRMERTTSMVKPQRDGKFHSLSERFQVVREKVTGIRLEASGAEEVTIPVGSTVPITLTYSYPESVHEVYAPDASEVNFQYTESSHPIRQIAEAKHLDASFDEHGNPTFVVEAKVEGTVKLSAYVDNKVSNALRSTIVPAS